MKYQCEKKKKPRKEDETSEDHWKFLSIPESITVKVAVNDRGNWATSDQEDTTATGQEAAPLATKDTMKTEKVRQGLDQEQWTNHDKSVVKESTVSQKTC